MFMQKGDVWTSLLHRRVATAAQINRGLDVLITHRQ